MTKDQLTQRLGRLINQYQQQTGEVIGEILVYQVALARPPLAVVRVVEVNEYANRG